MNNLHVEVKKLNYLYESLLSALIAVFSVLLLIAYSLNGIIDSYSLYVWLGVNVIVLILRTLSLIYYKRTLININNVRRFYILFLIPTILTALLLGSGAFIIFPDTLVHQIIIVFMLVGLTAGASVSLASKIEIFYIYLIVTLSPYLYLYSLPNTKELNTFSILLLIYIVILSGLSKKISKNINNNIELAYENKNLIGQLEDKVEEANSANSIKSKFLANMSHELRTPLNAIIGFSQILQKDSDLPEKPKLYIDKINISGNKLLQLINSILDFSKIEAGQVKLEKIEFDLYDTIETVITQLELNAKEKDLKVIVTYAQDVNRMFKGDSLRISQILTNLLSNAIKFTDNGAINLHINRVEDNKLRFEVKDTGIGLSQEQQDKLFKPFTQADEGTTRNYGGTGLGLSIAKELVELMNGRIWIESELGEGTSFIFEIELQECNAHGKPSSISDL